MTTPVPITVALGDGIGPEIMPACLRVLDAAGAKLALETIEVGEAVYKRGVSTGIEPSAWESFDARKSSTRDRSSPRKAVATRA